MSPSPSTAVPSETTATVFCLIVRFQAESRIVGDRLADPRHARRVGHREIVARLDGHLRAHLDLAAEVHEERPVGDALDLDAVDAAHALDDPRHVVGVGRLDRDVAHLGALVDAHEVDRAERASRVSDRLREARERPRRVGEPDADRGAERRGQVAHARITPSAASAAISSVSYPASRSISDVCSPTAGGADRWQRPLAVERDGQRREPEVGNRRVGERLQDPERLGLWGMDDVGDVGDGGCGHAGRPTAAPASRPSRARGAAARGSRRARRG